MLRPTEHRNVLALAAYFLMALAAPCASLAGNLDFLWPADDATLGHISWTGLILNPDAGYDTLDLHGSGSGVLKNPKGFRVGGEVGYDVQIQGVVLGAAADGFYSLIDGHGRGAGAGVFETDLEYFGTLRARLGYSFGRFMAYGTGGWAYGKLDVKDLLAGTSDSNALNGWVAGGGIEYVWNKTFTLRGEYQHIDFGSENYSVLSPGQQAVSAEMNIFRFGAITRF